jgi:hypothetical protein
MIYLATARLLTSPGLQKSVPSKGENWDPLVDPPTLPVKAQVMVSITEGAGDVGMLLRTLTS